MSLLASDLEEFVATHRAHGPLDSDTGELTLNGYRLTVACPCGMTFLRWITPQEVAEDLAVLGRRN